FVVWWWLWCCASCGWFRLWAAEGGRGDCLCHLLLADKQERDRDRQQRDDARDPESGVESAGQCCADGLSTAHERRVVGGGDARGDRDPERAAELLGGIDQPRRESGFMF